MSTTDPKKTQDTKLPFDKHFTVAVASSPGTIWCASNDHGDTLRAVAEVCRKRVWHLWTWNAVDGLSGLPDVVEDSAEVDHIASAKKARATAKRLGAVESIKLLQTFDNTDPADKNHRVAVILLLQDLDMCWADPQEAKITVAAVRAFVEHGKKHNKCIIGLTHIGGQVHEKLQPLFVPVPHGLPDMAELGELLEKRIAPVPLEVKPTLDEQRLILEAGKGLTRLQFDNAVCESQVRYKGAIKPGYVWDFKVGLFNQEGLIEVHRGEKGFEAIGGQDGLKRIGQRLTGYMMRKPGIQTIDGVEPLGLLLVGPPGCLHADTMIYDPTDESTRSVKDRWEEKKSFTVVAVDNNKKLTIAKAEAPWRYEPAAMLELVFSTGRRITVTSGHLFWLGHGEWISAGRIAKQVDDGYGKVYLPTRVWCPAVIPSTPFYDDVVAVNHKGIEPYYDFHVPEYENYLAEGLIHHNTGKTLYALCLGYELGLHTLLFDMGKTFGMWMGESEAKMDRALALFEAHAPAIVVIDEIGRMINSDSGAANRSGGTETRVVGKFLTWLSSAKRKGLFIIGTTNDASGIQTLCRSGRFDMTIYTPLKMPRKQKDAIWDIYVKQFQLPLASSKSRPNDDEMTPAEIEQVCKNAMMFGLSLEEAAGMITQVSETMAEDLGKLDDWGKKYLISSETGKRFVRDDSKTRRTRRPIVLEDGI